VLLTCLLASIRIDVVELIAPYFQTTEGRFNRLVERALRR